MGGIRRSRTDEPLVTSVSVSEAALAIEQKGGFTHWLNGWLADNFNKNLDAYDKQIDCVYNRNHIGGPQLHHLLDGQHTIWGAFKTVHDVSQDDTWVKELSQAGEHLLRDTASRSGANPFLGFTPEQFNHVAGLVEGVGISKAYLADALTINGTELIGGVIALAAAVIMGVKAAPESLSRLGGAFLVSAVAAGNPVLMPIAAGSLVYAAYKSEDKMTTLKEGGKGALVSGGVLVTHALVGGPVWLGLLAGVMTGIAINYTIKNPEKAWKKVQGSLAPARGILRSVCNSLREVKYAT
jgi:hypothetical protein